MENGKKPAFATKISYEGQLTPMPGLTKREYFAAMAMQGLLASSEGTYSGNNIASSSVGMADKLLKALETKSE